MGLIFSCYMVKNSFQIYILVRHELAHSPTCFFQFCICIKKFFWYTLVISDRNDSAHNWSLGTPLSYIPEFTGLVVFLEQTLLYQTLYLEFYLMRTWTYPSFPKKRFSLIIQQNLNYYIPFDREFHGLQNMIHSSKKKLMIDSRKNHRWSS